MAQSVRAAATLFARRPGRRPRIVARVIDVVGLTARGWADLGERERDLVGGADLIIGSRRLLAAVALRPEQRSAELPSPLRETLPGLVATGDRVVVLASGDPLAYGIATTLLELGLAIRVHPAVSSIALARARLGWPLDSCADIRDVRRIPRELAPGRRLLVLSADEHTPAYVSRRLTECGYGGSRMTVLGDLGTDVESARSGVARGWSGESPRLSIVAVECQPDPGLVPLGWVAGLPDETYESDGQLTKRDVRAAVLARLAPTPGELLWDVGAGSGSIAIEWCRAHPDCRAVAVERDPKRGQRIRDNAERLGVPGLRLITGEAPAALAGLPAPDAVFLGGSGSEDILRSVVESLRPGGRVVATAVTLETERLLLAAQFDWGGDLVRLSVDQIKPVGRYHAWSPALPVTIWSARR